MKWFYFALVTYAPALVWSVLTLPILFKYSAIHRFWPKTLAAGVLLSAIPYPLAYYVCRKVGFSCPSNIGPITDFLVMTGTVCLGVVLAGIWNLGFDRMLRKDSQVPQSTPKRTSKKKPR